MTRDHDKICLSCPVRGACCYLPEYRGGHDVSTDEPCPSLDVRTGLCTVYEGRFDNPDYPSCLTREEMIEDKTVPVECLYIKNKKLYARSLDRRFYPTRHVPEALR